MHKIMKEVEKLSEIKDKLVEWTKSEIDQGRDYAEQPAVVEGLGEWIDMIKDIAEAQANCMKKKYYEMMICSLMEQDESMNEAGRMGYDNWRYASGQFAPKGHGTRRGYNPMWYNPEPDMLEDFDKYVPQWKMGYPSNGNGSSTSSNGMNPNGNGHSNGRMSDSSQNGNSYNYRMGYPMDDIVRNWDDYKSRRRFYTESGNEEDKHRMNERIEECCMDSLDAMKEMWQDANPETRKKLEAGVTKFLEEMRKMK